MDLNESFSNAHASASWCIPKASKKGTKNNFCSAGKDSSHKGGTLSTHSTVRGIGINEHHGENGMGRHGGSCDVMFVIHYLSGGDWHGLTLPQSFGKKFSLALLDKRIEDGFV